MDLTPTAMSMDIVNVHKPAGVPATALVNAQFADDGRSNRETMTISGAALNVHGTINFGPNGELAQVDLPDSARRPEQRFRGCLFRYGGGRTGRQCARQVRRRNRAWPPQGGAGQQHAARCAAEHGAFPLFDSSGSGGDAGQRFAVVVLARHRGLGHEPAEPFALLVARQKQDHGIDHAIRCRDGMSR